MKTEFQKKKEAKFAERNALVAGPDFLYGAVPRCTQPRPNVTINV